MPKYSEIFVGELCSLLCTFAAHRCGPSFTREGVEGGWGGAVFHGPVVRGKLKGKERGRNERSPFPSPPPFAYVARADPEDKVRM